MSNRSYWIDNLRGFAILFILFRHVPFNEEMPFLMFGIRAVSVQIFFVISGYLYDAKKHRNVSLKSELKIKAKAFLLPYFILQLVNLLATAAISFKSTGSISEFTSNLPTYLWGIFYGIDKYMPNSAPLWYVLCAFVAYFIFWLVYKSEKVYMQILGIGICIGIYYIIWKIWPPQLPWHAEIALLGVVFMYIGQVYRKYEDRIKEFKFTSIFMLVILAVSVWALPRIGYVDINNLYIGTHQWLTVIETTACVIPLLYFFSKLDKPMPILNVLGKETIIIMGLNLLVMELMHKLLYRETLEFYTKTPVNSKGLWFLECYLMMVIFWALIKVYTLVKSKIRTTGQN